MAQIHGLHAALGQKTPDRVPVRVQIQTPGKCELIGRKLERRAADKAVSVTVKPDVSLLDQQHP